MPLERAVALDPGNPAVNKVLASAYMDSFGCFGGMNLHLAKREACRAETACRASLAVVPDDADALLLLGEILTAEVNWGYRTDDAAIGPLKRAIEIRPNWPEAYCSLGNAYRLLKRYEEALAAYTIEADARDRVEHPAPPHPSPDGLEPWQHHQVGDAYMVAEMCTKIGRFNEALRWLLSAEKIDPEDIVIHFWAGKTYLNLGDIESAKRERQTIAGLRLCSDKFLGYQCDGYGKSLQDAIEAAAK